MSVNFRDTRTTRYVNAGGGERGIQFLRDAACVNPGLFDESRRRRRSRVTAVVIVVVILRIQVS